MTEEYNQAVAAHYAAYRPPLHNVILERVLSGASTFSMGLDVGCGTGYSTTALAVYCTHVYGIDPSPSMLDRATKKETITYLNGSGEKIPLANQSVDVVTFAGSLFYADLDKTAKEITRVCRRGAFIIPYDFEILLDDYLKKLEIDPDETDSGYNHGINFSGIEGFEELIVNYEEITIEVSVSELAHILLSDLYRYRAFADKYNVENPFHRLIDELKTMSEQSPISAGIYYSKYQLSIEQNSDR